MKIRTIIFGTHDYAQLAAYYLKNDGGPYVATYFCVDAKYMTSDSFMGLPVAKTENVDKVLSNEVFNMFVPLRDNALRRKYFDKFDALDYSFISYVSSKALINGKVGRNCFIQEFNNVQPFASVGDNCILWAGNHIGHHTIIEDDVTITSHCVVSGHCHIGRGSYIGVNATIRDGVTIAAGTVIGQGANVVKDITEPGTYVGNPAKKLSV